MNIAPEQAIQLVHNAASDFRVFLTFEAEFRGFNVPWHHLIMADFLTGKRPEWRNTNKMIRGFRLAAKSYVGRKYAQWRQLRIPETQVMIQSSSGPNANKFIRAYHKELHESPLTAHLAPPDESSELKFNLNGVKPEVGFSVEAAGLGTSVTGGRIDLQVLDDPEPDDDPEGWYDRVLSVIDEAGNLRHSPLRHLKKRGILIVPPEEATQILVLGQPHWSGSAYIRPGENDMVPIMDEDSHPLDSYAVLDIPVVNDAGEWVWPEMVNEKYFDYQEGRPKTVEEVKNGMRREVWELQFMLNYAWQTLAGAALHLDSIPRVRHKIAEGAVMLVDPADGDKNCEWGVSIASIVDDKIHIYFIGGFMGNAYEGDVADETIGESTWANIFRIAEEFKVSRVLVEQNLKSAASACRRYLSKTGRDIAVDFYAAKGQKLRRIVNSLEQPINNGMVSADPTVFKDPKTLRQFTRLRFDRLPEPCDRLDSCAALVAWMIENRGIVSTTKQAYDPVSFEQAVASVERRGVGRAPLVRLGRG